MPDLHIGARVQHDSHRATVRYLGRLPNRGDHVWAGLEWDDVTRGKHSGSVDGISHFRVTRPGSATFLKASKLGDGGRRTFRAALEQRYVADAADTSYRHARHHIGGAGGKVQFCVADASAPLERLAFVDLSGMGVAEPPASVGVGADVLRELRELRLADSLFGSVGHVHSVLSAFPKLRVLDVSRNVLRGAEADVSGMRGGECEALQALVLNGCTIAWGDVVELCGRAPNLGELRVYDCKIGSLLERGVFAKTFERLELLDLDKNAVPWDMVRGHLGALPMLRELYLSRNGLRDCDALQVAEGTVEAVFPKLETLSLAGNELQGWRVVNALHVLPVLKHLRIAGNPITKEDEDLQVEHMGASGSVMTGRMQAIARVGGIEQLDGSSICEDERRYAEKKYAVEVCAAAVDVHGIEQAKRENPRLEELWAKFELNEKSGGRSQRMGVKGSMRGDLVKVQMEAGARTRAGRRHVTRHIPRHVRVERVKRIAKRLLRIEGALQEVVIQVGGDMKELEDESRDIDYWLSFADEGEGIKLFCV